MSAAYHRDVDPADRMAVFKMSTRNLVGVSWSLDSPALIKIFHAFNSVHAYEGAKSFRLIVSGRYWSGGLEDTSV